MTGRTREVVKDQNLGCRVDGKAGTREGIGRLFKSGIHRRLRRLLEDLITRPWALLAGFEYQLAEPFRDSAFRDMPETE